MTNTTIFAIIALTSILLLGTSIVHAADHEDGPSLGTDIGTDLPDDASSSGPVPVPYPNVAKAIPDWVKFTMQAYLNDDISESELLNAFQFLEDRGIMSKSEKAAQLIADLRTELAQTKQAVKDFQKKSKLDADGIVGPNTWPAGDNVPPGSQIAPSQSKVIVMSASAAAECTGERSAPYIPGGQVVQGDISDVHVLVSPPGHGPNSDDPFDGKYYVAGASHTYTNENGNRFLMVPVPQVFGGSDENSSCWVRVAQTHASGEEIYPDEYGRTSDGDPDRPIIAGSVPNPEQTGDMHLKGSKIKENAPADDRPTEEVAFYYNKISSASDTVHDLVSNGETSTTGWDEGVAAFTSKNYDTTTDGTHELGHALGMITNAIEKEIQTIEGEVAILKELMDMFTSSSTSAEYSTQYRESDFAFVSRLTSEIDTKIQSLQTGLRVLEDMQHTAGDDAQLANIDLQNALDENQDNLDALKEETTLMAKRISGSVGKG